MTTRDRAWAGALAMVLCLAMAVFLGIGHGSDATDRTVPRPAVVGESQAGGTTPLAGLAPSPPTLERRPEPGLPPGWLEVCNAPPLSPEAASATDGVRVRGTLARVDTVLGQLQVHPDPVARAAGVALADSMDMARTFAEFGPASEACADQACQAAVWQRLKQKERALGEIRRQSLVQLALSTGDLGVYALAAQLCTGDWQEVGACRQVSLAEWARREPGNMAPWLRLAQEADARKDPAARDEALFRAAAAGRQDHHHRIVTRAVLDALPDQADGELQEQLLALVLQVRDLRLLPMFNLSAACTPELLRDPNRWQRCDALAEALAQHGDSMIELRAGARIGEAVGWSRDRVSGLRDEAEAVVQAHALVLGTERFLSCPAINAFRGFIAQTGELGERQVARGMLSRLGQTPAALAAAHRARLAALQSSAERAHPAPAASSAGSEPPADGGR